MIQVPPLSGGSLFPSAVTKLQFLREFFHLFGVPVIQHHDVEMGVIDFGNGLERRPDNLHRLKADGDQEIHIRQLSFPIHSFTGMQTLFGKHVCPNQDTEEAD